MTWKKPHLSKVNKFNVKITQLWFETAIILENINYFFCISQTGKQKVWKFQNQEIVSRDLI